MPKVSNSWCDPTITKEDWQQWLMFCYQVTLCQDISGDIDEDALCDYYMAEIRPAFNALARERKEKEGHEV